MKPIILLTPNHEDDNEFVSIKNSYTNAIINAGGIPLTCPLCEDKEIIRQTIKCADGLFLTGGDDVAPELYGEKTQSGCGKISRLRDNFELEAIKYAYENKIPTFGICRGIQIMNVAFGGTLYQDITGHMQSKKRSVPTHEIMLTHSPISRIYPRKTKVNSFHHQAIKALGEGLEVFARGVDGMIEGIFAAECDFFVGVQWHPEHMTDGFSKELFELFVSKAEKYKER